MQYSDILGNLGNCVWVIIPAKWKLRQDARSYLILFSLLCALMKLSIWFLRSRSLVHSANLHLLKHFSFVDLISLLYEIAFLQAVKPGKLKGKKSWTNTTWYKCRGELNFSTRFMHWSKNFGTRLGPHNICTQLPIMKKNWIHECQQHTFLNSMLDIHKCCFFMNIKVHDC